MLARQFGGGISMERATRCRTAVVSTWFCLLAVSAGAQPWNRDLVYAQRVAELQRAIAARPADPNPLIDLGAFYLKPLARRTVEAADGKARTFDVPLRNEIIPEGIKNDIGASWVFRGDTSAAWPYLSKAIQMDPRSVRAARELAIYYRMRGDLDRMKPHMESALRANPMDLDMCRLYLDHRTALVKTGKNLAFDLRQTKTRYEWRGDTRYKITVQPSAADLAQAATYERDAVAVQREAITPLQRFASTLSADPTRPSTPAKQAMWRLATAIHSEWIGELDKAAGTAAAGLREDPTCLDCLDYVIDLARGTHTVATHAQYKAILDRWTGADSKPTTPPAASPGLRR
jgi:tetratricopeptide (TPR) repeat protein